MKITEFKKLIREEVRKVIKQNKLQELRREDEPDQDPANAFYMYVSGNDAVQGDGISTTKELLKLGMDSNDVKNVGPVYMSKVTTSLGNYTTYLITSAINTKDNWFVVAPFDEALVRQEYFRPEHKDAVYGMWKTAMANKSKAKQISFKDYLNAKI